MYGPPLDCKGFLRDENSLRKCIRPFAERTPDHDEYARVPFLITAIGLEGPVLGSGFRYAV